LVQICLAFEINISGFRPCQFDRIVKLFSISSESLSATEHAALHADGLPIYLETEIKGQSPVAGQNSSSRSLLAF